MLRERLAECNYFANYQTRSHTQTAGTTKDTKITKKEQNLFMETQEKDRKAVVDKSSDSGCGGLTRPFWSDKRLRREHRERPLRSKFNSVEALLRPIPTKICVHPFSSASSALKVVAPRCCVSVLDFVSYLREALCSLVVPDFGFALANLLPLTTSNR